MSKCLTSIELLRAMAEPANPENAAIMAHLAVCDKCLNALHEWRTGLETAEYVPQPGDDEEARAVVRNAMQQEKIWKRFWNKCLDYFSQFKEFAAFCPPQPVFAGARRTRSPQVRTVTKPYVFQFESRPDTLNGFAWHADMTFPVPGKSESLDICFNVKFSGPLPDGATPRSLHFQGQELPLENGITHISCKDFWETSKPDKPKTDETDKTETDKAETDKNEIYVKFTLADGRIQFISGDIKPNFIIQP